MGGLFLLLLIGFGIFEILSAFYKRKMPDERTLDQIGMVFVIIIAPILSIFGLAPFRYQMSDFGEKYFIGDLFPLLIFACTWFGFILVYAGFQKLLIWRCTPKEESTEL